MARSPWLAFLGFCVHDPTPTPLPMPCPLPGALANKADGGEDPGAHWGTEAGVHSIPCTLSQAHGPKCLGNPPSPGPPQKANLTLKNPQVSTLQKVPSFLTFVHMYPSLHPNSLLLEPPGPGHSHPGPASPTCAGAPASALAEGN